MSSFQRILIPTDFSVCAEVAFQHGVFLAAQYQAEVHLLHVGTGSDQEKHRLDVVPENGPFAGQLGPCNGRA